MDRIATDKNITEKIGMLPKHFLTFIMLSVVFALLIGSIKDNKEEIKYLKNSVDSLKTNQYEANTQFLRLTKQLTKAIELQSEGFEGKREEDSLQTEAIELLIKRK